MRTATAGSSLSADPRRRWIIPALIPAALAVPWLLAAATNRLPDPLLTAAMAFPAPAVSLVIAIGLYGASFLSGRAGLRMAVPPLLCAVAPVALVYPWTVATRFPGAVGDISYFMGWLTRYPTLGPINIEVLAGLAAVLATGFVPVLAAVLFLLRAPRRVLQATAALAVIAYLPVLVRLDLDLLRIADIWLEQSIFRPVPVFGPMIRAMAVAAMLALAFAAPAAKSGSAGRFEGGDRVPGEPMNGESGKGRGSLLTTKTPRH